jgi:glycine betaine catabolism A
MNERLTPHPDSPLMGHCAPGLASTCYVDEAWFKSEQTAIWAQNWIYVGRDTDLAAKSMRRLDIAGRNMILVKDGAGVTRCFYNSCPHRGSELCTVDERPLTSRLIVCPYHQWSFDLEGHLVRTPFVSVPAEFMLQDHVRLWNGFLFVCLADLPPDFSLAPDLGETSLDHWPMADLVKGHELIKILNCNWKIFWENYNECLHCPGIHPELSAMVPVYGRGYMAENEAPDWTPARSAGGTALKDGASTWSMNGSLCGPEFPGLSDEERARGQTFVTLLPTMFIVAHRDYVRTVSLTPLGPEKTELKAEWLFLAETLADPQFDLANVVDFASLVMVQDGMACEMNQRGLRCDRPVQGTLMPQEYDVFRFQQWIRNQMDRATKERPAP